MKKIAVLLALLNVLNIFAFGFVHAEADNTMRNEIVKEKLSSITESLGWSEETVDNYLNTCEDIDDFICNLIRYMKYLQQHSETDISFDSFCVMKAMPQQQNDLDTYNLLSDDSTDQWLGLIPEKEVKDGREYTAVSQREKINYATGKMIYEETDLHLPGVNGLDLNLVSRYISEESAKYEPYIVPGDYFWSPEGGVYEWITHLGGYRSVNEELYGIGAGWGFTFTNILIFEGGKYLRLSDGSVIQIMELQKNIYTLPARKTDDLIFESLSNSEEQYRLTYKDGKREYFDHRGRVIRTEDRYGNKIEYFYSDKGRLIKIIDSVGRNITFDKTDETTLVVSVDGDRQCVYELESYIGDRCTLYQKEIQKKRRLYFYENFTVSVCPPRGNVPAENELLELSEVYYYPEWYSTKYTYHLMYDEYNEDGGYTERACIASRKDDEGSFGTTGFCNEVCYNIAISYPETTTVTEKVIQTGAQTEYVSNDKKLITSKKYTVPENNLKVETAYTYDKRNLLESCTQKISDGSTERSLSESYVSDNKGNVIQHTDVQGNVRTYQYDSATNVLTKMTEPVFYNGRNTTRYLINSLDNKGNIISSKTCVENINNVLKTTVSSYDRYGNVTTTKSLPEYMAEESFEYDAKHAYVTRYTKGNNSTVYTYDKLGRKISETDALGRTTKYQYNRNNQVVEITNPYLKNRKILYGSDIRYIYQFDFIFDEKGPQEKVVHDCFGNILYVEELKMPETEFRYDNKYHVLDFWKIDDGNGEDLFLEILWGLTWSTKQEYEYDSIGRMLSATDGTGTTKYEYDCFNRVNKIINPDLSSVQIYYDDINKTRTTIDEEGHKVVERFDDLGRQISQTVFLTETSGVTQSTEYDCSGQIIRTTDYNGNVTTYEYDGLGRQISTTNAIGEKSTVQYAPDLSYVTEFYPDQSVRQYIYYDNLGRVQSVMDEYYNVSGYQYDAVGNMISSTDRMNQTTTYQYNQKNLLVNKAIWGCNDTYTYDETGKIKSVARRENIDGVVYNNQVCYNYNRNGTVYTETVDKFNSEQTATATTEYNAANAPVKFMLTESDNAAEVVTNDYLRDNRSRVTGIQQSGDGDKNTGYTYYKNGLLKTEQLPGGRTNHYEYDGANRLRKIQRTDSAGAVILKYEYQYDGNGNQTECAETDKDGVRTTIQYQYDALNRLKKEINGHSGNTTEYAFDCKNNIIKKTVSGTENYTQRYIYGADRAEGSQAKRWIDVIKQLPGSEEQCTYYTQDANGNTTQKLVKNAAGNTVETTVYKYNTNNMLTEYQKEEVESGKITEVKYYYDALNRRKEKDVEINGGEEGNQRTQTEYYWYNDQVRYERITRQEPAGEERERTVNMWGIRGLVSRGENNYTEDGHGNVDGIYSESGEKIKEYNYDAYGNEIEQNPTDTNPYRYCSENYDTETGLIYLRARYYDPELGRFLTEDPAQDGLNWYAYCGNNPVNAWDPSGLALTEEDKKYGTDTKVYIALQVLNEAEWNFSEYRDSIISLQDEVRNIADTVGVDRIETTIYWGLKTNSMNGLSTVEQVIAAGYPREAYDMSIARNKADSETLRRYDQEGNGTDRANAFKHIYWSAYASKVIGPEMTKIFTNAHEFGWYEENLNDPEAMKMDLHNNQRGRILSEKYPKERLGEAVRIDITQGNAAVLQNGKSVLYTPQWGIKVQ